MEAWEAAKTVSLAGENRWAMQGTAKLNEAIHELGCPHHVRVLVV